MWNSFVQFLQYDENFQINKHSCCAEGNDRDCDTL